MVSIGELDGWVSHEDAVTSPRANNNLGEYTACRTNSSVWMESLAAVRRISERGASRKDQRARKAEVHCSVSLGVQQGQAFNKGKCSNGGARNAPQVTRSRFFRSGQGVRLGLP